MMCMIKCTNAANRLINHPNTYRKNLRVNHFIHINVTKYRESPEKEKSFLKDKYFKLQLIIRD